MGVMSRWARRDGCASRLSRTPRVLRTPCGAVVAASLVAFVALLACAADGTLAAPALAAESADDARIESYRALGLRASLADALSREVAGAPPGARRDALALELAGERLRDGRPLDALRLLAPIAPRDTLASNGGVAPVQFAWAVALRDAGYLEAASDAFSACDSSSPPFSEIPDVLAYLTGTTAHRLGRIDPAIRDLTRAADTAETTLLEDNAERALLFALVESGQLDAARRRLWRGGSVARLGSAELVLLLADRLIATGSAAAAESVYDEAADGFSSQPAGVAAFRSLLRLRAARGAEPDAALLARGAQLALDAGAWESSIDWARRASALAVRASARDSLRLLEGRALYRGEQFSDAASLARALRRATAARPVSREALILLARSERKRGRAAEARAEYERFLEEFADDPFAEEVLWDLAWGDRKAGRWSESIERFRQIGVRFPAGKRRDEALFQEALAHLALGDAPEAARTLERLTARCPTAPLAAQALFFRIGFARAAGDDARAAALAESLRAGFTDTFYATYLVSEGASAERPWWRAPEGASDLAGRVARDYDAGREEAVAREWAGAPAAGGDSTFDARRLRRSRLLAAAGLGELLEAECALIEKDGERSPWRDFLVARLDRRHGLHHAALSAGSRFANARPVEQPGDRPVEVLRFLYPPAYLDVAADAARDADLDPRLLLAIAREESWFEADVVSAAGAVGLCQFMPATGRATALALGDSSFGACTLRDPAVSLRLGAAYLASLLREFDGSLILAAAAYNGGEGNAREWRAFHRAADPPASIESISFTETRAYVKKVLRSLWTYRRAFPAAGDGSSRGAP